MCADITDAFRIFDQEKLTDGNGTAEMGIPFCVSWLTVRGRELWSLLNMMPSGRIVSGRPILPAALQSLLCYHTLFVNYSLWAKRYVTQLHFFVSIHDVCDKFH